MMETTLEEYAEAWRQRFQAAQEEDRTSAEAARRGAEKAVPILRKHGATKIVLFGSLCSGSFRRGSDIDLAVEGIPVTSFTRALADLMMALDGPVDLKPLEEVEPRFRERVLREGVILYEKA